MSPVTSNRFYFNFSGNFGYSWEECLAFGILVVGGPFASKVIQPVNIGDRFLVYKRGEGYRGVAIVVSGPRMIATRADDNPVFRFKVSWIILLNIGVGLTNPHIYKGHVPIVLLNRRRNEIRLLSNSNHLKIPNSPQEK